MRTKKNPAKKQPASKETIRKRVLAILLLVAIFSVVIVLSFFICKPMLEMAENPAEFRAYMHDKKPWSIIMFMICMFLQVVVLFRCPVKLCKLPFPALSPAPH